MPADAEIVLLRRLAVVFTCDECAADHFPGKMPDMISGEDIGLPIDPRACAVHASCAAEFVACGFTLEVDDEERAGADDSGVSILCPHIAAMVGDDQD